MQIQSPFKYYINISGGGSGAILVLLGGWGSRIEGNLLIKYLYACTLPNYLKGLKLLLHSFLKKS